MSEYTPGPWRVIDETDVLALEGTPSSIVIAGTKFFQGPSTSWERANAQLMAASPEAVDLANATCTLLADLTPSEIERCRSALGNDVVGALLRERANLLNAVNAHHARWRHDGRPCRITADGSCEVLP